MRNVWFTADTHFGHARIIDLCGRPFSSVHDMNEAMIDRWNAIVSPRDVVWHLGDFAFADHQKYFSRLNGEKHLIRGNHDQRGRMKSAKWQSVSDLKEVTVNDSTVVLCHYALRTWNRAHYGSIHLYGHSHGKLPPTFNSLDVGVDCWQYAPVSLEEVQKRLSAHVDVPASV